MFTKNNNNNIYNKQMNKRNQCFLILKIYVKPAGISCSLFLSVPVSLSHSFSLLTWVDGGKGRGVLELGR